MERPGDRQTTVATRNSSRSARTSPFVGRDDELEQLRAALALAAEGQGSTIFLTGQPGIGKTRLAREAASLARERGFTVLEGRAYPLGAGLAYAPLVDAFSPLLRGLDPTRLARLVSDLPSLGRLFEGLSLPAPEPLGDPALDKTRLFEAVSRLLQRLAGETPVVLLVDDLHRADPASLELLNYLARGLVDQRTLLLATYGAEALSASRSLRQMVRSLKLDGLMEEVVIPRLEPHAVEKLVEGILGGETPEDLLVLLNARAGGIPLFVEAFVAALVDSGNLAPSHSGRDGWVLNAEGALSLPQGVRDLILERLERLAPEDRRLLDLIAVMGDGVSHNILRAASGLDEETLLGELRHLRDTGLLAESTHRSDVTYTIAHPLVQEVAYSGLPEMERRDIHMAAIKALESRSGGQLDDLRHLARHYRGAGSEVDPDRALVVLMAAGERALSVHANEEAACLYSTALTVIRDRTNGKTLAGSDEPLLPPLLERLGEAWERIGERRAAVGFWNEALAERERRSDATAACRLRSHLALAEWDHGNFDRAEAHIQIGLAALSGREPCQELADLNLARFNIFNRLGDTAGMAETAADLLAVADRLSSPRAKAEASLAASISRLWDNDVVGARNHALNALVTAEQAQELATCCIAHNVLLSIGRRLGDHNVMRYHAEQALAVAQRLGGTTMEILPRLQLAWANFMVGDWDESLENSDLAIGLARRVGYPRDLAYSVAGRALILALRGDWPEAEACVAEVRTAFTDRTPSDKQFFNLLDLAEATLALERKQVERALEIAQGFRLPAERVTSVGLTPSSMPMGLALLSHAQVAAGDVEGALETASKIPGLGPPGTRYLAALSSRMQGLAYRALGQQEAAVTSLARAHGSFNALGMPFEAARCLLEQAEAGAEGWVFGIGGPWLGEGPAPNPNCLSPVEAARQSLATFEHLGAKHYAASARRLLRGLGVSPPVPHRTRARKGVLSEREQQVARLVAEGLTTAEIAERLVITPRTVTAHLEHIYTRIRVRSRAALVRYLAETDMLSLSHHNM